MAKKTTKKAAAPKKTAKTSGTWIPVKRAKVLLSPVLPEAAEAQIIGRGQDLRLRLFNKESQLVFDHMVAKGFITELEVTLLEQKVKVAHKQSMAKAG